MTTKRAFDLSLLVPVLPAWAAVTSALAAVVWLCDGRPMFFSQPRVGRGGRPFAIWKLRTMTLERDTASRRPTHLGRWLRERGLDELPQLYNVLRGDMSLVGPRPLTPADTSRLAAVHPRFVERATMPPGLTGVAQVSGVRGAARTAEIDAQYAALASPAIDLAILLRTAWINVVGKRAGRRPTGGART